MLFYYTFAKAAHTVANSRGLEVAHKIFNFWLAIGAEHVFLFMHLFQTYVDVNCYFFLKRKPTYPGVTDRETNKTLHRKDFKIK